MMNRTSQSLYQEISKHAFVPAYDCGWACIELLPSAAYSIRGQRAAYTFGLAFERQKGVHAVGRDKREDFDAWTGELACIAPDVEIFSESARGGEYLTLHANCADLAGPTHRPAVPRVVSRGDRRALSLGWEMRRLLLAPKRDALALECCAALLLKHGLMQFATEISRRCAPVSSRAAYGHVLDQIEANLDGPLSLNELANAAGVPLLRFLRGFTATFGATPHAYIVERRLQRACQRLRSSDDSIATIAADCGFAHQSHMGTVLKNRLGMSPREYRRAFSRCW